MEIKITEDDVSGAIRLDHMNFVPFSLRLEGGGDSLLINNILSNISNKRGVSTPLDGEYIVSGTYQILDEGRDYVEHRIVDGKHRVSTLVENRLCISNAHCPGRLKYFMEYLCNKFKTRHVLFYNIMNMSVWRLRGFNVIEIVDPILDEVVTCLEGYWEETDSNGQRIN